MVLTGRRVSLSCPQYAQRKRTYQPAVGFRGVGHQVINNTVGDAPHCGMLGGGNDVSTEPISAEIAKLRARRYCTEIHASTATMWSVM